MVLRPHPPEAVASTAERLVEADLAQASGQVGEDVGLAGAEPTVSPLHDGRLLLGLGSQASVFGSAVGGEVVVHCEYTLPQPDGTLH